MVVADVIALRVLLRATIKRHITAVEERASGGGFAKDWRLAFNHLKPVFTLAKDTWHCL
jgi:hypothetical protein